jgi:ABC-type phosphate transport system ATPase subunit
MEQDEQVLDKLNALDQSTLTEREVWQEARERAYAQAAFLLTSGGRQQRASK